MPLTVKKHKRSKIPRHKTNIKRLKKNQNKVPRLELDVLQKSWNHHQSAQKNMSDMGLSYDSNVTVSKAIKRPQKESSKSKGVRSDIADLLVAEAKAPRVRKFKFPNTQATYFTYLIKKYGDNYKEMAKDSRNVYQETWKKIRSRIRQFKTLDQYQKFMSGQK